MGRRPLVADMIERRVEIAERLELIRKHMKMSKTDFAGFIGISNQYYATLAKGENFLAIDKLINFAIKSNTSIDYLLLGQRSNNYEINSILEHLSPSETKEMVSIMKSIYTFVKKDDYINDDKSKESGIA